MSKNHRVSFVWNRLRLYASVFLLAFYTVVGGIFIFSDTWKDLLPNGRFAIGIVLILFGILRFYVAYRRYMSKDQKIKEVIKEKTDEKAS
jgi:hypothetical protein